MNHLSTKTKDTRLDEMTAWAFDDEVAPNQRPFFDMPEYQKRLDRIVGVNKDRKSVIRLVWCPEIMTGAFGEEIPRYWQLRKAIGKKADGRTEWSYQRVPRYALEQRHEKESYADAWNRTRYAFFDPETETPLDKGDPPEEYYSRIKIIAEHDPIPQGEELPACCARRLQDNKVCYGYFRLPNDEDLEEMRQAIRWRDAQPFHNPYEPLTMKELYDIERMSSEAVEFEEMKRQEDMEDRMRDFSNLHGWRLTETDPTVLKHGRRHFIESEKSKLWLPDDTAPTIEPVLLVP